jgi:hypothetical protein
MWLPPFPTHEWPYEIAYERGATIKALLLQRSCLGFAAIRMGGHTLVNQYAPLPRKTTDQVFQRICRSRAKDQFST